MNADGYFGLKIIKVATNLCEYCYGEIFLTQNNISLLTLKEIVNFLGIGKIYQRSSQDASDIKIANLKDINIFISKFTQTKFRGTKALDYADFVKGINLINNKAQLTKEGLIELKTLSQGMNKNRHNTTDIE